jgi:hypothetical protein
MTAIDGGEFSYQSLRITEARHVGRVRVRIECLADVCSVQDSWLRVSCQAPNGVIIEVAKAASNPRAGSVVMF